MAAVSYTHLCRGLRDLGPENVVVTDVAARPGLTGAAVLARGMDEPLFLYRERYEGLFHGCLLYTSQQPKGDARRVPRALFRRAALRHRPPHGIL